MEETITVNWDASVTSGSENLTLDYLECENIEEWNALDKETQRERIQQALDELPERVNPIVDDWD
jgi:hypothetical protein|tara:strand:- start:124 stop:318 length:195 start_codon:yes stop_codon:yes gene_type:complete